jgi:hypothetical protein
MADEKILKSGQFTIARLLFLAACGAVIVGIVALGGQFLSIGYLLLSAVICVLLYLVAIDYGVKMDTIDTTAAKAQALPLESAVVARPVVDDSKTRKRGSRTVKRRR